MEVGLTRENLLHKAHLDERGFRGLLEKLDRVLVESFAIDGAAILAAASSQMFSSIVPWLMR